jgi:hypothetical protein
VGELGFWFHRLELYTRWGRMGSGNADKHGWDG